MKIATLEVEQLLNNDESPLESVKISNSLYELKELEKKQEKELRQLADIDPIAQEELRAHERNQRYLQQIKNQGNERMKITVRNNARKVIQSRFDQKSRFPKPLKRLRINAFKHGKHKIFLYNNRKNGNLRKKIGSTWAKVQNYEKALEEFCDTHDYEVNRFTLTIDGHEIDCADKRLHNAVRVPTFVKDSEGNTSIVLEKSSAVFMQLLNLVKVADIKKKSSTRNMIDKIPRPENIDANEEHTEIFSESENEDMEVITDHSDQEEEEMSSDDPPPLNTRKIMPAPPPPPPKLPPTVQTVTFVPLEPVPHPSAAASTKPSAPVLPTIVNNNAPPPVATPSPVNKPIQQSDGNAQCEVDESDEAATKIRNEIGDLLSDWEKEAEKEAIDLSKE